MLKTGRSIRNLGKKDLYRVLRWGPMAVADLVAEFFDTEPLRATIAARGIFGTFLGPGRQAALWFCCCAPPPIPSLQPAAFSSLPEVRARSPPRWRLQPSKLERKFAPVQTVAEIRVKDGVATGVVLASGEEISARAVVSNADPKRTLMRLVDPAHLSPDFLQKIKNYRSYGTVAKINLALSALPEFTALKAKGNGNLLQGPHSNQP